MRLKVLELKKMLTVASEFSGEVVYDEERESISSTREECDELYSQLNEEDKQWVDDQFYDWMEEYVSQMSPSCSCSGCGKSCGI